MDRKIRAVGLGAGALVACALLSGCGSAPGPYDYTYPRTTTLSPSGHAAEGWHEPYSGIMPGSRDEPSDQDSLWGR